LLTLLAVCDNGQSQVVKLFMLLLY